MILPDICDSFDYGQKTFDVQWFDVDAIGNLPDVTWSQVYAIAKLDTKVALVAYANSTHNLPGGTPEPGESIDTTLRREIQEELNCRVLEWVPIGYQKVRETGHGEPIHQLRVYARLEKIGDFEKDPGGDVTGYKLIELRELNSYIHYGKVGERIMQLVADKF